MNPSRLHFRVEAVAEGSRARAATFQTLHNKVTTPLFMPVGTHATVKAQMNSSLEDSGSQILLANTYHLLLRPGPEVFRRVGGIHSFMSWDRSVLTDSGGFQIFSLPHSRSITEEGAVFQSYLEGNRIVLSPETSIETQKAIGSDIMMVLDHCVPSTADEPTARAAVEITERWARRSLATRGDSPQSMFAIVQGALFADLRRRSAEGLCEMPFDGFAIGGLAVGEGKSEREDMCEFTAELLPRERPRYLMGVGTPLDILEAVHRGVDMFDCIIPTQLAQRGVAFTSRGIVQMRRGAYKHSTEPLDAACTCAACARYTRAYLHHLTKAKETTGWQLLGIHNIHFYHQLMREIRASILAGKFLQLYAAKRAFLQEDDLDNSVIGPRPKVKETRLPALGAYEIHSSPEGFGSIRHVSSGEFMHSRNPPLEEAHALYVEQSALSSKLSDVCDTGRSEPLVIWDVGLGAAANAMAAVRCYEETAASGPLRPMRIVSFENDLDSLRLAFRHNRLFPYLRHSAPAAIVAGGAWRSKAHPGLEWAVVPGAFGGGLDESLPRPDLIFYDMFSSKTHPGAWTLCAFRSLFAACRGGATELFTYTCSTAIRAAFLAAGFHVAKGRATGPKSETTVALTPVAAAAPASARYDFLSGDWLGKWGRSGAKFPAGISSEEQPAFEVAILSHPQFRGASESLEKPFSL